jgi:hypothetical protein
MTRPSSAVRKEHPRGSLDRAGFDSQYFRDALPLAILYLNDRERRAKGAQATHAKMRERRASQSKRIDAQLAHPLEERALERLRFHKRRDKKGFAALEATAKDLGISKSALEKKVLAPARLARRIPRDFRKL